MVQNRQEKLKPFQTKTRRRLLNRRRSWSWPQRCLCHITSTTYWNRKNQTDHVPSCHNIFQLAL